MVKARPVSVSECSPEVCGRGGWTSSPWSPCSASCGLGTQTRTVSCRPGLRCDQKRPTSSRHCRGPCRQEGSGWVRLEEEEEEEEEVVMDDKKVNMSSRAEFLETSGQSSSLLNQSALSLLVLLLANL